MRQTTTNGLPLKNLLNLTQTDEIPSDVVMQEVYTGQVTIQETENRKRSNTIDSQTRPKIEYKRTQTAGVVD